MSFIRENLELAKLHIDRLERAKREIEEKNLIENLDINDFETVKVLDSFIFRFIKKSYIKEKNYE